MRLWSARWVRYLAAGAVIGAVAAILFFALARPVKVLPRLDPAPAFVLDEAGGGLFRSYEPRERFVLYLFGAARDTARVEPAFAALGRVRAALATAGWSEWIAPVFITLDPQADGARELRALQQRYREHGAEAVTFLTGASLAIKLAAGTGFGIYYEEPVERDGALYFGYEPVWILVDEAGVVRARYDPLTVDPERVARDVGLLVKEAGARGAARLTYSAAHLFMCYPR